MKAIVAPKMTNAEFKALQLEIRRQCVELCGEYETLTDAAFLWAVAQVYGTERLDEIYDTVYTSREKLKSEFCGGISEIVPFMELQKLGIDVAKWHSERGLRYTVEVNDKKRSG